VAPHGSREARELGKILTHDNKGWTHNGIIEWGCMQCRVVRWRAMRRTGVRRLPGGWRSSPTERGGSWQKNK
jgi:hypothetical protein